MSPPPSLQQRAARQALALALLLALAAFAVPAARQRPAGIDEMKILTAMLRSQSAELRLLGAHAGAALPPSFVRAHAQQLGRHVEDTSQRLRGTRPAAGYRTLQPPLQRNARALAAQARALQQAPRAWPAGELAAAEARTEALATAELALKR